MAFPANSVAGCVHPSGKWKASCTVGHQQFGGANVILKALSVYRPRNISFTCSASPNNHRRIPDLSRQRKGSSRGKNCQFQEQENSESPEESDPSSSKNGSLLSLSSNQRFSAVATPGKEREIVELFRKVQAQLRERAAAKEERKMEAAQQVQQGERGTVDSLLKLLRKHAVTQGKKSSGGEEVERSDSSLFGVSESDIVSATRPPSKFQCRSPVPRAKFQLMFSPEEVEKSDGGDGGDQEAEADEVSDSSDTEIGKGRVEEAPAAESSELALLKLVELRDLAKSRGIKGYSKLKKGELIEMLTGDCA